MATKKTFNHKLGDSVKLALSGDAGSVISRANSLESNPLYLVRYLAGDGRQVTDWIAESALEAA